jgi:hypothetical protein
MKVRIILLGIILGAALIILPAGADSTVAESTFGLFDDETDIFVDPNDYDGVEFDNAFIFLRGGRNGAGAGDGTGWTGAITGRSVNDNTAGIAGGLATRIGSLYLGIGFDTNLWHGSQTITKIDGDQVDPLPFSWPLSAAPDRGIVFDGGFEALIGTENLGAFKVTLDFDQVSLNSGKNETSGADPEEFAYSDGSLLIGLGWGKNFEFKGGALAPEFLLAYQISTYKLETKNSDAFTYVTYWDDGTNALVTDYFEKMSHLLIGAAADYTSPSEAHSFTLEYLLDIGIHPSTIEKAPGGKDIDWKGYHVGNGLAAGYSRSVELNDRFSLGFGADLGLELVSRRTDYTDKADPDDSVSFIVNPEIKIGASYAFAKKPFTLYSAFKLSSLTDTDGDDESNPFYTLDYAKEGNSKTETWTHTFGPWGISVGLGLTFAPFDNFTLGLDLSQNLSYYLSDKLEYVWSYDVFDWSSHPFTAAIQATIKF